MIQVLKNQHDELGILKPTLNQKNIQVKYKNLYGLITLNKNKQSRTQKILKLKSQQKNLQKTFFRNRQFKKQLQPQSSKQFKLNPSKFCDILFQKPNYSASFLNINGQQKYKHVEITKTLKNYSNLRPLYKIIKRKNLSKLNKQLNYNNQRNNSNLLINQIQLLQKIKNSSPLFNTTLTQYSFSTGKIFKKQKTQNLIQRKLEQQLKFSLSPRSLTIQNKQLSFRSNTLNLNIPKRQFRIKTGDFSIIKNLKQINSQSINKWKKNEQYRSGIGFFTKKKIYVSNISTENKNKHQSSTFATSQKQKKILIQQIDNKLGPWHITDQQQFQ